MRLFLIRHGETVDNVAQVYAGSRDSGLTNHGFQQATRLGQHFRDTGIAFTHIFSSTLKRAVKTAELIREPQMTTDASSNSLVVVQLPCLVEQDFGSLEGKSWKSARHKSASNVEQHEEPLWNEQNFVKVESKESLAKRLDGFVDDYIIPLASVNRSGGEPIVAVVSHSITLSVLWKRLLLRLSKDSVSLLPGVEVTRSPFTLERLGAWSNTGYLELQMDQPVVEPSAEKDSILLEDESSRVKTETVHAVPQQLMESAASGVFAGWTTKIKIIDGKTHLKTLRRTRGGVGSAEYDEGQKTISAFFAKPNLG